MWDPGNKRAGRGFAAGPPQGKMRPLGAGDRGFTLIELMLVVGLIAMASAGVVLALRDNSQSHLEREAQRLIAMLESARAQSRATGLPVYWRADGQGFEFVGSPSVKAAPDAATGAEGNPSTTPWLGEGVEVPEGTIVALGPVPIIERLQIVLSQGERSLRITTDGLRPFAVQPAGADETGSVGR